jgi:putative hydrolase of the HAD superfamily
MAPSPDAPFDAVLFDAGGVLVVPTPEVFGPVVERFGGDGSTPAIVRAHYAGISAMDRHSLESQHWPVYGRSFVAACGVSIEVLDDAASAFSDELFADIDNWRFPLAESVAALRRLHHLGIRMGVVSNADGQIAETLRREGVCQVGDGTGVPVEVVIDSNVVGVSKPDPRIFAFALDAMGLDPERVVYVGDAISKDVIGARNAGLHPIHVDPYGDHPDADHDRISSLHELVAWLI